MDDIKDHPRARVVGADSEGNPIYSTQGLSVNKKLAAKVIEFWLSKSNNSIASISRHLKVPQHTVSRYIGFYFYKKESDETVTIRLKSNV